MLPIQPQAQKAPQRQSVQLPPGEVIKSEHKKFNQEEEIQKLKIEQGNVKQRLQMFGQKPVQTSVPFVPGASVKINTPLVPQAKQEPKPAPEPSMTDSTGQGPIVEKGHDLMHLSVKERVALMQKKGNQNQQVEFPKRNSVKIDQPINLQERMKAFQNGGRQDVEDQGSVYQPSSSQKQEEPEKTDQTTPEKHDGQQNQDENYESPQQQQQQAVHEDTQQQEEAHQNQNQNQEVTQPEENHQQSEEIQDNRKAAHEEVVNNEQNVHEDQHQGGEQQNEQSNSLPVITKTDSHLENVEQQAEKVPEQQVQEQEVDNQVPHNQQQEIQEEHQEHQDQQQQQAEVVDESNEQTVEGQEQN